MASKSVKWLQSFWPSKQSVNPSKEIKEIVKSTFTLDSDSQIFVRIAGVSGVLAVILGAYGAHAFRPKEQQEDLKIAFETGNRYHLLHTLALLAVPLTKKPKVTGILLIAGMLLFSGSCYYYSLTKYASIRRVTPYGGMLLIAAWASMIY